MTQKDKLTADQMAKLEAAIRDAIPNDGAYTFVEVEGCQKGGEECGLTDEDGNFLCEYCQKWNGQQTAARRERPLTLQDVLIALGEDYSCDGKGQLMAFDDDPYEPIWLSGGCPVYDLTKSYQHQSPAFYSFLYSLLIK